MRASGARATAIPSESVLAARFGASQGTVRKAIAALAADNLVVRRQGKGTFVATHTERSRRCSVSCESVATTARTNIPAAASSTSAGARRRRRRRGCSDLDPGDPVLLVRRVLEYAGEPVVLDEITLPARSSAG